VIAAAAVKIGDELAWWQRTTVYQIYPRSFADANGDGIGDLPGILDRLDHLSDLGVETLWLSPFFASPQRDFGYDVADYDGIAPEYGTMADCERLIEAVHARGMKIVLDLVLNHTSDQHPWFLASRRGEADPMRAFYIWRKGRKPGGAAPPNNWVAMTGGSGWHYDAATDAWYWASFLPFQPDLNYHNPAVREAMLGVVRRWLERDELCRMLATDELRLNVDVCRARKQFSALGIQGAASIVDRRMGTGRIRLGVERVDVRRM